MSENLIIHAIDFIKAIGTPVVLPILILWLTNRYNRKNRVLEQNYELKKIEENKRLEEKYKSKLERKNHEVVVHSSLIKILFEVQKLHISLSGRCVDYDCIDKAINEFQSKLSEIQNDIVKFQIYLSSNMINRVYKIYNLLTALLVELKEITNDNKCDIAIVSVHKHSRLLANEIIVIHNEIVQRRDDLTNELDALDIPHFSSCCGNTPSQELIEKYEVAMNRKLEIEKELEKTPNLENRHELLSVN